MADEKRDQSGSRRELAAKLDKDLDDHINKVLEKNKDYKYDSGITADNVEEKLKTIPAFLNEAPTQEDIDASPALQALQALKYEQDNPEASALAHKEDGNYHFKKKEYRKAIKAYTEGLKQKIDDKSLIAILYTNRAASHSHLGNNRSALNDATFALKAKPDHMKAVIRATISCFDLEKYDECLSWCDKGFQIDPKETKLLDYKKKATLQKKQKARDERKKEMKQFKDLQERSDLISAMRSRCITLYGEMEGEDDELIGQFLFNRSPRNGKVYLDEKKRLHWPLHLLYPEYNQSDFIEDMNEENKLIDQLGVVFSQPAEWDVMSKYTLKNIEVFFEDRRRCQLVRVDINATIKQILSDKRFSIVGECPSLMVLSNRTDFYTKTFENQSFDEL